MQKIIILIQRNPLLSKYWLGIVVIFAMIVSIRTYLNYLAIEVSIENVRQETAQIRQRKFYEENFLIPYENSEYNQYFLRHENNMLLPGEYIIRFERPRPTTANQTNDANTIQTPQDSRQYFIRSIAEQY
jgi:predicted transcriptional regulator